MRSTLLLLGLLAVGLAISDFSSSKRHNGLSSNNNYLNNRRRSSSPFDSQDEYEEQEAKPFQAGYQYTYTYDGQISSGLDTQGVEQSTGEQQRAVTRIQAQAQIQFRQSSQAVLRLRQVRVGQLNQLVEEEQQVQPMEMFEKKQVEQDKRRQLELPVHFEYQQGVVQRIHFHQQDQAWSKNIKRAVLNLIQLNLQRAQQQEEGIQGTSFTLNEISIEGDCQTTYTINKNTGRHTQQGQKFNVTKTIDFKQCQKIADVGYGFQTEQQNPECAQCQKEQYNQNTYDNQQQNTYEQKSSICGKCDPKEIKEQRLSRSTMMRFVLQGQPQQPAIQRAELLSQYVFKNLRSQNNPTHSSTMQTVVVAQLVFRQQQQIQDSEDTEYSQGQQRSMDSDYTQQRGQFNNEQNTQQDYNSQDKDSSLLYDPEWDVQEKRFYMLGDHTRSPFQQVPHKVEQAQQLLRKLSQALSDNGMEFDQLVQLQRLVELFRWCSVQELKQIADSTKQQTRSSETDSTKMEQLVADCLAMAGTRNTIEVLAERITQGKIPTQQAFQALKSLQDLPAPSDAQAKILLDLCQHNVVERHTGLKQACWLTSGSMVGELCQKKNTQTGFFHKQCEKKETYWHALQEQFERAQGTYEKVLALKAIGNAGLDMSITRLQSIIQKKDRDVVVRVQAIDALRRLRTQMPKKVQRVLLPIFQDTKEKPQVRMAAFACVMRTQPEQSVLDQITYSLIKEGQPQVKAFVYSTILALTKSKVPAEQQMVKHLKNTLKMANIEDKWAGSRKYRLPIYSKDNQEGIFLNLVSVFGNKHQQLLPNHLALSVDSLLNDQYTKDSLKVGFTQRGMEQWYESVMQTIVQASKSRKSPSRAQRSTTNKYQGGQSELRDIYSRLNIERRRGSYRSQQQDGQWEENQPFAMVTLRIGDVDQAILPIDQQTMPQLMRQVLNEGQRPSLSVFTENMRDQHFRLLSAMNIKEKNAKVPTSVGVPLRILQAVPIMASLEGSVKVQGGLKAKIQVHPSICIAHIQKMESWMPIISTGVESTRALEFNMPVQAEIQSDQQGIQLSLEIPQQTKTRVLGVHTLPSTYTREWDARSKQHKEPKVKSIHTPQLEQLQRDVDKQVGEHSVGMPFHLRGHYHWPSRPTDYNQVFQVLMATENHIHLTLESSDSSPRKIMFRISGGAFQKTQQGSHGPELDNFYSKANQFEQAYPEDDFEGMQLDGHEQRRQKLNSFLGTFQQGQTYDHSIKLSVHTQGGRKQLKAHANFNTQCDAQFMFCKVKLEVQRTPMLLNENQDWTLKAKVQVLQPHADSHPKLVIQEEVEWGAERKQYINVRVQAEQAYIRSQGINSQQGIDSQLQGIDSQKQSSISQGSYSQQQNSQPKFLNKIDVVAEYKLQPAHQQCFSRIFELLKAQDPWSVEQQMQQSGQDGRIHANLVIQGDLLTLSIRTPSQTVRIQGLPMPIRPFSLQQRSRRQVRDIHSVGQLFQHMTGANGGRAECKVDGKRVATFDGILYKAPIGKCYSVLAKDCASGDQPRFVVLMKAVDETKKKIKVISPQQTIECYPSQGKLQCKVNGQVIDQDSNEGAVEFTNEQQVTIDVEGVKVRFGCWCEQCKCQKAWLYISSHYKQGQCGLCGHYDDQADDEFRMGNNQLTEDLSQFHRSYSLQDDQCSSHDQNDFYSSNKDNFQTIREDDDQEEDDQQEDYRRDNYGQDWQTGNYLQQFGDDYEQDTEQGWNNGRNKGGLKKWQLKKQQKKQQKKQRMNNLQGIDNQQGQDSQEPIEQTKVLEFNHKICFSVEPVKQCPEGTSPASEYQDDQEEDEIFGSNQSKSTNSQNGAKKTQFVCVNRSSSQARQLQRQARKGVIVTELQNQSPSFVEAVQQPTRCVAY